MFDEDLKAVIRKLPVSISEKELRLFLGDEAKKSPDERKQSCCFVYLRSRKDLLHLVKSFNGASYFDDKGNEYTLQVKKALSGYAFTKKKEDSFIEPQAFQKERDNPDFLSFKEKLQKAEAPKLDLNGKHEEVKSQFELIRSHAEVQSDSSDDEEGKLEKEGVQTAKEISPLIQHLLENQQPSYSQSRKYYYKKKDGQQEQKEDNQWRRKENDWNFRKQKKEEEPPQTATMEEQAEQKRLEEIKLPQKKFTYKKKEPAREPEMPQGGGQEREIVQEEKPQQMRQSKPRQSKREETTFQIMYKNRPEESEPGYGDNKWNKGSKSFRPTYKRKNQYGETDYSGQYNSGYNWNQSSGATQLLSQMNPSTEFYPSFQHQTSSSGSANSYQNVNLSAQANSFMPSAGGPSLLKVESSEFKPGVNLQSLLKGASTFEPTKKED